MRTSRVPHRTALPLALALVGTASSCVVDEPLGPPGKNMTGPVTTVSVDSDDGESDESGTPGDTPGCDPLADPESECGPDMACDLTSLTCVPALGTGLQDDPCTDPDECSPGLWCASGRCRELCDVEGRQGCEPEQICSVAEPPIPGLCLAACQLAVNACELPGDACKRVLGAGGQVWAACVENPGFALAGDPCSSDGDCAAGYLCTAAALHTLPCVDQAASCCAPVCDTLELPCFGVEPVCYTLAIPGQESAGFCGAEQ
ncbi:MAG TPA: hypothetical protein VK034_24620 [Enhygromyxa sp.]|nr:hypothetical protein [Enhygromyxa sp.]